MIQALRQSIRSKHLAWLDKRIPKADKFQLDNQSIFILPTKFGGLFLCVTIFIFLIGTNYQSNILRLLSFFLLSLFIVHMFASYLNFARLFVSLGFIKPIFAGTTAAIPLHILPSKVGRPARGTLWINFMQTQTKEKNRFQSVELDDTENIANIRYFTRERGIYVLPRMTLQCDYPLGLFRCWTHLQFAQLMTVYPSPVVSQLKLDEISQLHRDAESAAMTGKKNDQNDDFAGLNKYQRGDPLHSVAWKQMARTGQMMTKEFVGYAQPKGYLHLPVDTPIEKALGQLSYQINYCQQNNIVFGLFLPHVHIAPGQGDKHKVKCLDALASFPTTAPNMNGKHRHV